MSDGKIPQGTAEWFDMVGSLLTGAARRAGLAPTLTVSLVERYTDGAPLGDGLVQGLRLDIVDGRPSFRPGAGREETGDVTIEITAAAAGELNSLYSADPAYAAALERLARTGAMKVTGDPSRLGDWLGAVHDAIVDRTGPLRVRQGRTGPSLHGH